MLKFALFTNLIMILCELLTLGHIKKKRNIFKYYTYLQNLLALLVSVVFAIWIIFNREIPEFIKGLRYIATCGLSATLFMFLVFLGAGKTTKLTENDFLEGFSANFANAILHYICPVLSLISFVFFERDFPLSNGIWTSLAAIPSCLYWIIYGVLSATKLWEEPYVFTTQNSKSKILEVLTFVLIPFSFIAISFILWILR